MPWLLVSDSTQSTKSESCCYTLSLLFQRKEAAIESRSDDLQQQMTIAVLDWFLLEGGEPLYESDPDGEHEVELNPELFEVRMPEFEVFVGPPTEPGAWAIEVAVNVRPAIPLEVDVVEALLKSIGTHLPDRLQVDVYATEDFGSVSTVWLAVRLTRHEVESSEIDRLLGGLLTEARAMQTALD